MANVATLSTSADLSASQTAGAPALIMPTGVVLPYAGNSAPSGWLACDGSAISRTTYASLFAAISTSFGVGDGSTTFNLPDLRGRFPRFNDAMFGGSAAGRDSGRVHGSAQADATARKGLTVTNNAVTSGAMSANASHNHTFGNTPQSVSIAGVQGGGGGTGISSLNSGTLNAANVDHTHNITSNVVLNTGDAETRPINLSINAIIKI